MMDLAQERERLIECDRYGVKTTRQWNIYHREWERQHPVRAQVQRVAGRIALVVAAVILWAPVWVLVTQLVMGD
jgi:hypothetical protein